ncbi:hypothetical protein [Lactococcus garvieae]|uniref:Uncharacterized protein n=1 Tax=Lactococcus garvieae DCC43 TaxID=1231377 RepID=K2PGY6_9LACT|nr:hypothetical protein [Lactococcus garvieae]EKF50655.1 hypothetical protein C426_2007 [Lactococcus garvieae DCC43]
MKKNSILNFSTLEDEGYNLTDEFDKAIYILQDGTLWSGYYEEAPEVRAVEHREIETFIEGVELDRNSDNFWPSILSEVIMVIPEEETLLFLSESEYTDAQIAAMSTYQENGWRLSSTHVKLGPIIDQDRERMVETLALLFSRENNVTPEIIQEWNEVGGAPAVLRTFWDGLSGDEKSNFLKFLDREYPLLNEKEIVSDQDDKQYALVWALLHEQIDLPNALDNMNDVDKTLEDNRRLFEQEVLEQQIQEDPELFEEYMDVAANQFDFKQTFSVGEIQNDLLKIEAMAELLNIKISDTQREKISQLPPEGRKYMLNEFSNLRDGHSISHEAFKEIPEAEI